MSAITPRSSRQHGLPHISTDRGVSRRVELPVTYLGARVIRSEGTSSHLKRRYGSTVRTLD